MTEFRIRAALILACLFLSIPISTALAATPSPPPELPAFAQQVAKQYGLDLRDVQATLAQAQYRQSTIDAMSRPAEAVKPWKDYRPIFVTAKRIRDGRAFLAGYHDQLMKVQTATGVPAEIIVAIIGVETGYGSNTGSYRVLDALYTLAFWYPRSGDPAKAKREADRQTFFRDQLAQLFALAHDEGFTVTSLTGSYAGAMGWGQFMPSSYRDFAKDGDGDGRADLFGGSMPDLFASVANYFVAHGWRSGEPVAVRADKKPGMPPFVAENSEPKFDLAALGRLGYRPQQALGHDLPVTLLTLEGVHGSEDWITFNNFYVITRYNKSPMYSMAVFQLAEAIAGRDIPDPP
ncbi:MAG: lytic murein transglycosylase B [Dokdonella sp.]